MSNNQKWVIEVIKKETGNVVATYKIKGRPFIAAVQDAKKMWKNSYSGEQPANEVIKEYSFKKKK